MGEQIIARQIEAAERALLPFALDVEAITAALGPRTRAVIINTPHNPTGRIYPPADLQRLGRRWIRPPDDTVIRSG